MATNVPLNPNPRLSQDLLGNSNQVVQVESAKLEVKLHTLGKDNYTIWKQHTKNVLEAKNLIDAVQQEQIVDSLKEKQARALLTSALDADNQMKVINCQSAHRIWKRLESIYENKTTFEAQNLYNKLHTYKIHQVSQVSKAIGEIENLVAKLRLLGEEVSDNSLMSAILRALPSQFATFITCWKGTSIPERTVDNLIARVMAEVEDTKPKQESALVSQQKGKARGNKTRQRQTSTNNPRAKNTQHSSKGKSSNTITCHYCKEPGHIIRNCTKLKAKKAKDEREGRTSTEPEKKERKSKEPESQLELMAIHDEELNLSDTDWITDSGATSHMTSNRHWLTEYEQYSRPSKITIGDGSYIQAVGYGKIVTPKYIIKDVLYVPNLSFNLFSIGKAAEKGLDIVITGNIISIVKNSREIIRGKREGGIYTIQLDVKIQHESLNIALISASLETWHQRLGHISKEVIKKMADSGIVSGLRIGEPKGNDCLECAQSKCTRASHQSRTTRKARAPGEVLHFDTAGPIKPETLGDNRYFILCKDEASSYRFVRFAAYKQEVPNIVKTIISEAELGSNNRALKIYSDNGSEYKNENLTTWLQDRGINHGFSAPYTPQQNGLIEREIRTVLDSARTMLLKANLTQQLWAEAVSTAVYLLNRVPTRNNPETTPYELWFKLKPNLKHLKVFGQRAFIHKPEREIESKWDVRSEEVYFVGYTPKVNTYRFFNANSERIIISCNATFPNNAEPEIEFREEVNSSNESESEIGDGPFVSLDMDSESERSLSDQASENPAMTQHVSEQAQETRDNLVEDIKSLDLKQDVHRQSTGKHIGKMKKTVKGKRERKTLPDVLGIPKNLYIMRKPPQIMETQLRSRQNRDHAMISTIEAEDDPRSYQEAMARADKHKWLEAMKEEINSLRKNLVWILVDRPKGNVVSNRWVLRIKRKPDGTIDRYRARLVARGFSQVRGLDYNETYAPVVNTTIIRLLYAFAASADLIIAQFDVKTAFLYGSLDEVVFMEQPEGFIEHPGKVCRLQRSLYGLKQAPRQWNRKFSDFLTSMNLRESENEPCVFFRKKPLLIIAIYVDDGVIMAHDQKEIDSALSQLKKEFEIHIVDNTTFLGFQVERDAAKGIFLHQRSYLNKIVSKFGLEDANSVDNPSASVTSMKNPTPLAEENVYREAIGSLLYASTITRIDIAYAVNLASRHMAQPTTQDWIAVKRIFRYLNGAYDFGIYLHKGLPNVIEAYCDANFVDNDTTAKSTTGYVITYGGVPIHWRSQKQSLVTLSSTEAEIVSLCSVVKEVIWLRKIGLELDCIDHGPVTVYCDNLSAIKVAENERCMHRTKHFLVRTAYIREQVENKTIELKHIPTAEQPADVLTKPISSAKFRWTRSLLMSLWMFQIFLGLCNGLLFNRVSPIVWTDTSKYVDQGIEAYMLQIHFINPCSILSKVPTYVISNLSQNYGQSGPGQRVENPQIYNSAEHATNIAICNGYYTREVEQPLQEMMRIQQKNQLRQQRGIIEFVAAMFLTNVVDTVRQKIWPKATDSEISVQEEVVKKEINKLNDEVNITAKILTATNEGLRTITEMLKQTNERISITAHQNQELAVLSSYIIARIVIYGSHLRRMRYNFKHRRVEFELLAQMIDGDLLDELEESSAVLRRAYSPGAGVFRIEFSARRRAPNVSVYRVDAFRYWSNLTHTPSLMEYSGERYLIYNQTNHCAKAISEPTQDFVTALCVEEGYGDPRLALWSKVYSSDDPGAQIANTSYKEAWPYVYVYCYRLSITLASETARCPTYVFSINASLRWNTTDVQYIPNERAIELSENFYKVEPNVHSVHFRHNLADLEDVAAIDRIHALNEELKNMTLKHIVFNLPVRGGFTYINATWALLWLILFSILIIALYLIHSSRRDKKRHERVMETVTDGIYGDGTYAMVRRQRDATNSRNRNENTHVSVHLSASQTTPQLAPPLPPCNSVPAGAQQSQAGPIRF